MRRTRYVVLPVRSWHYIGLMVVSLACLTLGSVSRDREGKSGSLTSPELKHTAPHEVDACPNDYRQMHRSLDDDDDLARQIDSGRRVLERRVRTSARDLENRRLSRMYDRSSRRQDMRARIDERRAVSLDRRSSDVLREERNQRLRENRVPSELNARRVRLQERLSTSRRERTSERMAREDTLRVRDMSTERRERNALERRDRARLDVRRENIRERRSLDRQMERRSLDRQMERRERAHDRRENRRTSFVERESVERRGRVAETSNARSESIRNNEDSVRRQSRVNLEDRQLSRERRSSLTDGRVSRLENRVDNQRSNSRRTVNYLKAETEFPMIKSSNGSYEMLRQTFILALCTVYTASLFKQKSGFIGNIMPQINRLRVW